MRNDDSQVTAAACRYVLVSMLTRLERTHPGLLAELMSGTEGDRQALASTREFSGDVDGMFAEVERMLRLSGAS